MQFLAELILCDVGIDSDNQVRQTVHCYVVEMNFSYGLDDPQNKYRRNGSDLYNILFADML